MIDAHCDVSWTEFVVWWKQDAQEAASDLRPLVFDAAQHVVLSEELKHLYTAITRAKNAVVIYDSNPKKRAPFFYYLRTLKLASVVKK